jgi:hypothetical protein
MRTPFEISGGNVQEMPDLSVFLKLHDAKTKSREFAAFLGFAKEKKRRPVLGRGWQAGAILPRMRCSRCG